ncbi:MAG: cation transporter [Candidatus Omnitrophica bacterium]|nr:cation transporter [Candidatus Omnitrophota bacterium]
MEDKCVRCGRIVPWICFLGNSTLTLFKIYIGYVSGSKGLIADGIHSGTDVIATLMVIVTLAISGKKEDKTHPWGYGKAEFLGAALVYMVLLGIALLILYDAVEVILSGQIHPPHIIAFFGALVSIIANYILSGYGFCAGRKLNSPAMIANANENRADLISSIAVLFGIVMANVGFPILDSLAAVLVGLIIAKTAIELGIEAFKSLIDESLPMEKRGLIEKTVLQYREVKGVNYINARRVGHEAWIDMEIFIDPKKTVTEGHMIAREARAALMRRFAQIKEVNIAFTCKETPNEKHVVSDSPEEAAHPLANLLSIFTGGRHGRVKKT